MHLKILLSHCFPVDTVRKLNVHKTFRGRPGHLLNVLCTFNLCPVSTGFSTFFPFHKLQICSYIVRFWYNNVIGIKIDKKPPSFIPTPCLSYLIEFSDPPLYWEPLFIGDLRVLTSFANEIANKNSMSFFADIRHNSLKH